MGLEGDWEPENPLGVHLPLHEGVWPDFAWELAESRKSTDPIKGGLYAWAVYGVLCVVNFAFYSDRFYYVYTQSKYATAHLAFKSWWGILTYGRNISKVGLWGLLGLFWVLTFIPVHAMAELFGWLATIVMVAESVVAVLYIIAGVLALWMDGPMVYQTQLRLHNYWDKAVYGFGNYSDYDAGRNEPVDFSFTDFNLTLGTMGAAMTAYPMLQAGIAEARAHAEKEAEKAKKAEPKKKEAAEKKEEEVAEEEEGEAATDPADVTDE